MAFDVEIFLLFDAKSPAQNGLGAPITGEVAVIALGEQAAVGHHRIDLIMPHTRDRQAFLDRGNRNASAIGLAASQPLLRDGGERAIIVEKTSRGIMARGAEAKDKHGGVETSSG